MMLPLITREASFGQHVCELVFGVNVTDLDLGVQINSVKQPIKRLDTCLMVGLLPLMIILITASSSPNMYN